MAQEQRVEFSKLKAVMDRILKSNPSELDFWSEDSTFIAIQTLYVRLQASQVDSVSSVSVDEAGRFLNLINWAGEKAISKQDPVFQGLEQAIAAAKGGSSVDVPKHQGSGFNFNSSSHVSPLVDAKSSKDHLRFPPLRRRVSYGAMKNPQSPLAFEKEDSELSESDEVQAPDQTIDFKLIEECYNAVKQRHPDWEALLKKELSEIVESSGEPDEDDPAEGTFYLVDKLYNKIAAQHRADLLITRKQAEKFLGAVLDVEADDFYTNKTYKALKQAINPLVSSNYRGSLLVEHESFFANYLLPRSDPRAPWQPPIITGSGFQRIAYQIPSTQDENFRNPRAKDSHTPTCCAFFHFKNRTADKAAILVHKLKKKKTVAVSLGVMASSVLGTYLYDRAHGTEAFNFFSDNRVWNADSVRGGFETVAGIYGSVIVGMTVLLLLASWVLRDRLKSLDDSARLEDSKKMTGEEVGSQSSNDFTGVGDSLNDIEPEDVVFIKESSS